MKVLTNLRFWDVDLARGVAIVMVILYHLIYDLDNFGGYGIESTSGIWGVFADVSAFMFVFLVGLSLSISYERAGAAVPGRSLFGKYLLRGLRIFGYGMLVTFLFWVFGFGAVVFGILHLIGLSLIFAYPFLRLRYANLLLGLSYSRRSLRAGARLCRGWSHRSAARPARRRTRRPLHAGLPSTLTLIRRSATGCVLRQRRVPALEEEISAVSDAPRRRTSRFPWAAHPAHLPDPPTHPDSNPLDPRRHRRGLVRPRPNSKPARTTYNDHMKNTNRTRPTQTPSEDEKQYPERAKKAPAAAPTERDVREASDLLKVVGDLTRMRTLCTLLSGEELSVGELQKVLGMSQSAVSHQLRVLRDANLVKFRRAGKLVYYSLADEHVHELLLGTLEHIRHD